MIQSIKLFTLFSLILCLFSCNSNERQIKKFFKRINANEINSASKYVWPEDHSRLFVLNRRFLAKSPLTNFEVIDIETDESKKTITANVKLLNAKPELLAYFDSLGVRNGDELKLNFAIKTANETDYISLPFEWTDCILPEKLQLSSVQTEKLNLRSGPGTNFKIISTVDQYDELLIDANYSNQSWRKGYTFEQDGTITPVFLSSKLSDVKEISFFSLGYFASMSLLTLTLIGILVWIVIYPIALVGSVFGASEAPGMGLALLGLLVASLYFTYQLLENFLFEVFMINLPY